MNKLHPTIMFTTEQSGLKLQKNLLVMLQKGTVESHLYVNPKDNYQCLEASSCLHFHCKKDIP